MPDPQMQPKFEDVSRMHGRLAELFHRYADAGDDLTQRSQLQVEIDNLENDLITLRAGADPWLNPGVPTPGEEPVEPSTPPTDPDTDPEPTHTPTFWVNPDSMADREYRRARNENRADDAGRYRKLAERANTIWYVGGHLDAIERALTQAATADVDLALVIYDVPGRDNGGHSRGGAADLDAYKQSIDAVIEMIVRIWPHAPTATLRTIIEPDAVNLPDYLDDTRKACLGYVCHRIAELHDRSQGRVQGYIDAGHSNWRSADEVAERIQSIGVPPSTNLVSNVSSFQPTARENDYLSKIAKILGGRRWIIDTSRNGLEQVQGEWCNPWNVIAGSHATTQTGLANCDAFIPIKPAGESDGNCAGGPNAGEWFADWALAFVERSEKAGQL